MSLVQKIKQFQETAIKQIPQDALAIMMDATAALEASGIAGQAVQAGQTAPDFDLPELAGGHLRLSEMLTQGPVVISFYRGDWCPYCNLEMQALQKALPEIEAAGGQLVAIAPETAEHAGKLRDKGNLTFPLLRDINHAVARQYGLVFSVPEALRSVYLGFGIDLAENQGSDGTELPMPATVIIGQDGVVAHAFVNADYTQRMEPDEIVKKLGELKS